MSDRPAARWWAVVVFAAFLVLAGKAVLGAGSVARGPIGLTWALGSLVLFLALFRRAERCLGQPVSATARSLGLIVALPGIAWDLVSVVPGLHLAALAAVLGGFWLGRQSDRPLIAGAGIGVAVVLEPVLAVLVPWILVPLRRRVLLGAIAGGLGAAVIWEVLSAVFDSVPGLLDWWEAAWSGGRSPEVAGGGRLAEWPPQGLRSVVAFALGREGQTPVSDGVYVAVGLALVIAARLRTAWRFPGAWSLPPAAEIAVALALAAVLDPRGDGGAFVWLWPAAMVGYDAFDRSDDRRASSRGRILWFGGLGAATVATAVVLAGAPSWWLDAAPLSVAAFLVAWPSFEREAYPTIRVGLSEPLDSGGECG